MAHEWAAEVSAEWRAMDLKEEARELWRRGRLEEALPLAQESARLREGSSRICLSLRELGGIYLEMLKIDEAEETARRMLREAYRYETQAQTCIAQQILADAKEERGHGFHYGNTVTIHGVKKVGMNGQIGEIRGRDWPQTLADPDRYRVLVSSTLHSIRRQNISLASMVGELTVEAELDGSLAATIKTSQGGTHAKFNIARDELKAAAVRLQVAESMGRHPSSLHLVLPDGFCIRDSIEGDAALESYADSVVEKAMRQLAGLGQVDADMEMEGLPRRLPAR